MRQNLSSDGLCETELSHGAAVTAACRLSAGAGGRREVIPPEGYDNFAQLLADMSADEQGSVSVLTFNPHFRFDA